jgi:hypothetical protein
LEAPSDQTYLVACDLVSSDAGLSILVYVSATHARSLVLYDASPIRSGLLTSNDM